MVKHFDSRELAAADLGAHGFRKIQNDVWVSDCKTIRATMHPKPGMGVVMVGYSAIERVGA